MIRILRTRVLKMKMLTRATCLVIRQSDCKLKHLSQLLENKEPFYTLRDQEPTLKQTKRKIDKKLLIGVSDS